MTTQTELEELCSRVRAFIEKSDADFERVALDIFQFQFERNEPYQKFCRVRGKTPALIDRVKDIPALPTRAFKDLEITMLPPSQRTSVFHSSGTTEHRPSRHF